MVIERANVFIEIVYGLHDICCGCFCQIGNWIILNGAAGYLDGSGQTTFDLGAR